MANFLHLTSANYAPKTPEIPDAILDMQDPLLDMLKLAGIHNSPTLKEYTSEENVQSMTSSRAISASQKVNYQKDNNIRPGTPEWFRLWFSRPDLTGESPY